MGLGFLDSSTLTLFLYLIKMKDVAQRVFPNCRGDPGAREVNTHKDLVHEAWQVLPFISVDGQLPITSFC